MAADGQMFMEAMASAEMNANTTKEKGTSAVKVSRIPPQSTNNNSPFGLFFLEG